MESNKLTKMMNILKFALVIIGLFFAVSLLFSGVPSDATQAEKLEFMNGFKMSGAINFFIFVFILGVALVLLFFVMQLISTPKKTIMSIAGILGAVVLFFIFKMAGTSDNHETLHLKEPISEGTLATTTAGIYVVGLGIVIAVVLILVGPLLGKYRK